jgi:hypothetical protein
MAAPFPWPSMIRHCAAAQGGWRHRGRVCVGVFRFSIFDFRWGSAKQNPNCNNSAAQCRTLLLLTPTGGGTRNLFLAGMVVLTPSTNTKQLLQLCSNSNTRVTTVNSSSSKSLPPPPLLSVARACNVPHIYGVRAPASHPDRSLCSGRPQ